MKFSSLLLTISLSLSTPAWSANDIERVSVDENGAPLTNFSSDFSISGDGRYVAFATNDPLTPGDTGTIRDVYVYDRETGAITLVSATPAGTGGNNSSFRAQISDDGLSVVFISFASDLLGNPRGSAQQAYVRHLPSGTTTRVSVNALGEPASEPVITAQISGDGKVVVFHSQSTNLTSGDAGLDSDVFAVTVGVPGNIKRVSLGWAGQEPDADCGMASISADGRYVVFRSRASDLVPGGSGNLDLLYRHDLVTGTTILACPDFWGREPDSDVSLPSISADGRYVSFTSAASDLDPDFFFNRRDVYVFDAVTNRTSNVTKLPNGSNANEASLRTISADGNFVLFRASGPNVTPEAASNANLYRCDRRDGTIVLVSRNLNGGGANSNAILGNSISADGLHAVFQSDATDLVVGDTNGMSDIFAWTDTATIAARAAAQRAAARAVLVKKIRVLKRNLRVAQRNKQVAKVKRFNRTIRALNLRLRRL